MLSNQLPLAKITYPLFLFLQRAAYKRTARIITISEDMKETLVEQGIERSKIDVVFNWSYSNDSIRLSDIPAEQILNLGMDSKKTNVVYAGNIGKMQNVEFIAKAALLSAEDTSVHYYIIGDGANKARVAAMVEGLTNVTVMPMQPAIYAESIYAQADINVIPLAKGGIKTALPSKTATILRTDTHAVFCIDSGSKFEELVKGSKRIHVANNTDPESLYRVICKLREKKSDSENDHSLMPLFSNKNSEKYVEIMEKSAKYI
jgi:colanic acid biosynthesis glycosyl transferase WcaI